MFSIGSLFRTTSTNITILHGLLLNYPECCIKQFALEKRVNVSINGFSPCDDCVSLSREDLNSKLGRDIEEEPPAFSEAFRVKRWNLKKASKVYKEHGQEEFFNSCVKLSHEKLMA